MLKINFKRLAAFALVSCLAFVFGCLFGPKDDKVPPKTTKNFKPLTEKENVIYNLVLAYDKADITHYDELLHANYTWHNQVDPLNPNLEEQWTRAQYLSATTNMFDATRGLNPDPDLNLDKLELDIASASWALYPDSIPGYPHPCGDCWETTREYFVTVTTKGGDTYIANDLCLFIVVPVTDGGVKVYKLWRADDLPM
jgi:hypothetical protein